MSSKTYDLFVNTVLGEDTSNVDVPINTVGLNSEIRGMSVALEYIHFMNSMYPVTLENNRVRFTEVGADTYDITLTPQNYSASDLAAELKAQMDAAGTNTYTVTYNTNSASLEISGDTTDWTFDETAKSAYQVLGVTNADIGVTNSSGTTYSMSGIVDVSGPKVLVIECQQLADYGTSRKDTNFLKQIPLQHGFGTVETFQCMVPSFKHIRMQSIKNLTLRLRDENGNPFVLKKNTPFYMNLLLRPNTAHK